MIESPGVNPLWILAMITCGGIGVVVHLLVIFRTTPLMFSSSALPQKGKTSIFFCILVFLFNGFACLIWVFLRTDLFIHLSINSCKYIYVTNFLCYFTAKYILHCLLIGRIYYCFQNTLYQMHFNMLILYIIIVSLHFFASAVIWVHQVGPHVLKGIWMEYSICTVFSEHSYQTFPVKCAAVSMGAQDFLVGGITLYILIKRFRAIAKDSNDAILLQKAIRYGNVQSIAMISTLFLFTLAVPFWPNVTFIVPVDAIINSLCVFCVLSIGSETYHYLCFPFRICQSKYMQKENNQIMINRMIIHKEVTPKVSQAHAQHVETSTVQRNTKGELEFAFEFQEIYNKKNVVQKDTPKLKLNKHYSEPLRIDDLREVVMKKQLQLVAASNPYPFI